MNNARIVVLAIAIGAGGIAAYLASGSDDKPAPAQPVAQLQTVDILVAKSDIALGRSVKPDDLQWQTWPAVGASGTFIKRNERPEATKEITGSIARAPFIAGEPIEAVVQHGACELGVQREQHRHHPGLRVPENVAQVARSAAAEAHGSDAVGGIFTNE